MTRILTPAIFATALFGASGAIASDDCQSPMSQWQSQDAAIQHAGELGIQVSELKVDDGCYEIEGRDSDGSKVELKLEPANLGLRELEVEFADGSNPSRYLEGARALRSERKDPTSN